MPATTTPDIQPEKFDSPPLTDEENRQQRGDDPPTVRPGWTVPDGLPQPDPKKAEQRNQLLTTISRHVKERRPVRQAGLWPYLLIRAKPGDHGVRPLLPQAFWESPDILVVPGAVDSYDGVSATLNPEVGRQHTIFVHVWNLGRLAAIGVKLRVYWADPAFSFNDPAHPPQLIGSRYLDLPDRLNPNCHGLFRIPTPWTPVMENGGHECLLAKVECFTDGGGPGWDANVNRHIGQRNLMLVPPTFDLAPLMAQLGKVLPVNADLQLLHGMQDLHPLLLAHQPALAGVLNAPQRVPTGAFTLPDGTAHLGAVASVPSGPNRFVPPAVVGPVFRPNVIPTAVLGHPAVTDVPVAVSPATAILHQLGTRDLLAGTIAAQLGASAGEGHVLRFQATKDGQVVGGYTVIVQTQ